MQKEYSSYYSSEGLSLLPCSHLELIRKCESYRQYDFFDGDQPVERPPHTQDNKDPENNRDTHPLLKRG
jgi:hypothetical protein